MPGYNTSWNTGNNIIQLKDVIRFLDVKRRRVHHFSARVIYKLLGRKLRVQKDRIENTDISVPIILVIDRKTRRPEVVLDGNHRLVKAVILGVDIPFRVLYGDEYDILFGL